LVIIIVVDRDCVAALHVNHASSVVHFIKLATGFEV
jgi:hypothetical protein